MLILHAWFSSMVDGIVNERGVGRLRAWASQAIASLVWGAKWLAVWSTLIFAALQLPGQAYSLTSVIHGLYKGEVSSSVQSYRSIEISANLGIKRKEAVLSAMVESIDSGDAPDQMVAKAKEELAAMKSGHGDPNSKLAGMWGPPVSCSGWGLSVALLPWTPDMGQG